MRGTGKSTRRVGALVIVMALGALCPQWSRAGSYAATQLYPLVTPDGPLPTLDLWRDYQRGFGTFSATTYSEAGDGHAVMWATDGTFNDLTPSGLTDMVASGVFGGDNTHQVGYAYGAGPTARQHAVLWSGSGASAVDLHPSQWADAAESYAVGVAGARQVGDIRDSTGSVAHAVYWTGTAASAVDLNPANYANSHALGTDGVHVVGYGAGADGPGNHPLLWTDDAASVVNLDPVKVLGSSNSYAFAVSGNQQVGWGSSRIGLHALVWQGTADSAVDLNPSQWPNASGSVAFATNGAQQVGSIMDSDSNPFAVVWSGTAASAVNLNDLLPAGFTSDGTGIDAAGNIYGLAYSPEGTTYAVEWTAVPEPASLSRLLGILTLVAPRRR